MDIKQMLYFKTIVEEGTISKAALKLHMAQPPLSMQLKQLEEELNVQLIIRNNRGIELTQAGKLFYKRSLQILSLSELTIQEIKDLEEKVLRIGVTSSNRSLISYLDKTFITDHKLSFRIHEGSTYEMIDLLLTHNIDMAFVRTPFDQNQVNAIPLCNEPMIAVGQEHFFHSSMTSIKKFHNVPLIIHQRYLSFISDYCLQYHFNPFIKFVCDDSHTSLLYAHYGYGVAIVPQRAIDMIDHSLHREVLTDKQLYTSIVIAYRKNEKLDDYIEQMIDTYTHMFTNE
ncbi:MAG: LysR family transcriptional regulator [Erysipelotrichaceae bacterium]|nr:LysR family transcriptional regulator [Erysipelotrichaceae bacterium]